MKYLLPDEPSIQTLIKVPESEKQSISESHICIIMSHRVWNSWALELMEASVVYVRPSLIEGALFYLFLPALPVNWGHSVNVFGRQLYVFHRRRWHWPAQHTQAGWEHWCQHFGQSSLPPRNLYRASICSKLDPRFLTSDQSCRARLKQHYPYFPLLSFDMFHLFHHSGETSIGRYKWTKRVQQSKRRSHQWSSYWLVQQF